MTFAIIQPYMCDINVYICIRCNGLYTESSVCVCHLVFGAGGVGDGGTSTSSCSSISSRR